MTEASASTNGGVPTVVLVHGGFVDGSGWQGVYSLLKEDGYSVRIVQNPTISLEGDVAATKMIIDAQSEPVILVGHSYGGAVISEAGNHPKVAGLVYIAAFVPDQGESVETLIGDPSPGAPVPPILPPQDGFLFLQRFAVRLNPHTVRCLALAQKFLSVRGMHHQCRWLNNSAKGYRPGKVS
jgi:pimeloyl-ACP methyl ester carboxylesterase